jgi:hypothetical protein
MPNITGENSTISEGGASANLRQIQGTEERQPTAYSYGWIKEITSKVESHEKKIGAHELILVVLVTIVCASVLLVVVDLFKDQSVYNRIDLLKEDVIKTQRDQDIIVNCLKYRKTWQYEECLKSL